MKPVIKNYFDEDALSPEQMVVANYLATPGRYGMTLEEIGSTVGVSARSISRWRATPAFAKYVQQRTLQLVSERLPEVISVVADRAEQGSAKHAQIFLQCLGLLKEHHLLTPQPPDDGRDNMAIERSIRELEEQLKQFDEEFYHMNKIDKLEQHIEQLSDRINEYDRELATLRSTVIQHERNAYDLRIQAALEPDREQELDREIAKIQKPVQKLADDIKAVEEKQNALKDVRARHLAPIREEAREELLQELSSSQRDIEQEVHALRMLRGTVMEKLIKIGTLKQQANEQRNRFLTLSSIVDDQYGSYDIPLNFPAYGILLNTYEGDHQAVLTLPQEANKAFEYGRAPDWFNEWQRSGEILSSAELNDRRAERGGDEIMSEKTPLELLAEGYAASQPVTDETDNTEDSEETNREQPVDNESVDLPLFEKLRRGFEVRGKQKKESSEE